MLGEPFDILEEAPGTYLIADRAENAVFRLRDGELETVAELPGPRDLEPTPDGSVLVASGRDVVALDPRTGATETVATAQRRRPRGSRARAAGPRRQRDGRRVVRDDGRVLRTRHGLDGAHGLLDTDAGLVVCDSGNGRVLLVGRNGRRRVLADGLDLPSFAAAAAGWCALRQRFRRRAAWCGSSAPGRIRTIADVAQPTALSVARDGSVLVTGLGGAVSRVDPETGSVEALT